jgi:hypothetical protein
MKLRFPRPTKWTKLQLWFATVASKHKKLVGAMLVAPICWLLFQYGLHGTPPPLLSIVALSGVILASFWFIYGFSRGFKPVTVPPADNSRIKKSTRLILSVLLGQAVGSLFAWFLFGAVHSVAPMPQWFKIGMLIFMNIMLFIWFLQQRSPDKESFNPKPW